MACEEDRGNDPRLFNLGISCRLKAIRSGNVRQAGNSTHMGMREIDNKIFVRIFNK
jgi:hypothetical protein